MRRDPLKTHRCGISQRLGIQVPTAAQTQFKTHNGEEDNLFHTEFYLGFVKLMKKVPKYEEQTMKRNDVHYARPFPPSVSDHLAHTVGMIAHFLLVQEMNIGAARNVLMTYLKLYPLAMGDIFDVSLDAVDDSDENDHEAVIACEVGQALQTRAKKGTKRNGAKKRRPVPQPQLVAQIRRLCRTLTQLLLFRLLGTPAERARFACESGFITGAAQLGLAFWEEYFSTNSGSKQRFKNLRRHIKQEGSYPNLSEVGAAKMTLARVCPLACEHATYFGRITAEPNPTRFESGGESPPITDDDRSVTSMPPSPALAATSSLGPSEPWLEEQECAALPLALEMLEIPGEELVAVPCEPVPVAPHAHAYATAANAGASAGSGTGVCEAEVGVGAWVVPAHFALALFPYPAAGALALAQIYGFPSPPPASFPLFSALHPPFPFGLPRP